MRRLLLEQRFSLVDIVACALNTLLATRDQWLALAGVAVVNIAINMWVQR